MFFDLTSTLDVVIGVVFLLLILSMIVSLANEACAKILSWRSENLKEGVGNLLSDPEGATLAGLLYQHPLIRTLGRQRGSDKIDNPSYIPSQRFAQALTETIRKSAAAGTESNGATRDGMVLSRGSGKAHDGLARMSVAGHSEVSHSGDAGFSPKAIAVDIKEAMQDARALVSALPESEARTALQVFADRAEGQIAHFEHAVAEWFDDGMDRVSGWYKRKVQKWLMGIALIVVMVLNANVFQFAQALRSQPEMAAELADLADQFHGDAGSDDGTLAKPDAEKVAATLEQLNALPALPMGWSEGGKPKSILWAVPGWVVTAMLVSLGAPFWFNMLGQLLDIRGSGRPPQKSRPHGASPAQTASGPAT